MRTAALQEVARYVEAFDGPSAIVWGDRDPVLGRARSRVEKALLNARL